MYTVISVDSTMAVTMMRARRMSQMYDVPGDGSKKAVMLSGDGSYRLPMDDRGAIMSSRDERERRHNMTLQRLPINERGVVMVGRKSRIDQVQSKLRKRSLKSGRSRR